MLRRLFRALPDTPRALLLCLRLHLRDAIAGDARYARRGATHTLPVQHRWRQAIHDTPTTENKRHNLRLAAAALHRTVLRPGDVFSFARIVGPPISPRGYRDGRTLVSGEVAASVGGGLCQLSGLLYLAALESGLDVVERHPHSVDIYTEATRFAPLGSDATVVYGHRDLRLRNPFAMPVAFRCTVEKDHVELALCCAAPLRLHAVEFRRIALDASRTRVDTTIDGAIATTQIYLRH